VLSTTKPFNNIDEGSFTVLQYLAYSNKLQLLKGFKMKFIYVLNCKGEPIMPTARHGLVRRLLKEHKAKVVRTCPFTIQLNL